MNEIKTKPCPGVDDLLRRDLEHAPARGDRAVPERHDQATPGSEKADHSPQRTGTFPLVHVHPHGDDEHEPELAGQPLQAGKRVVDPADGSVRVQVFAHGTHLPHRLDSYYLMPSRGERGSVTTRAGPYVRDPARRHSQVGQQVAKSLVGGHALILAGQRRSSLRVPGR